MEMETVFGLEHFEEVMATVGIDIKFRQMAPGIMKTGTWKIQAPLFNILYLVSSLPLEAVGAFAPDHYVLHVPVHGLVLHQNGEAAGKAEWLLLNANAESRANKKQPVGGCLIVQVGKNLLEAYRAALTPGLKMPAASVTYLQPDQARALELIHHARTWRDHNNPHFAKMARDRIITLLLDVLAEHSPPPAQLQNRSGLRQSDICRRARFYIDQNYMKNITILDLCQSIAVSHSTLGRAFRAETGMSPLAYLNLYRLHAFRESLWLGHGRTATISSLANRHGIRHFGRLSRRFHYHFGYTPSRFRDFANHRF